MAYFQLPRFFPLGVLVVLLLGGCTSSRPTSSAPPVPDSLRAENAQLRQANAALRDSLQFYDDIASGQYYRERRALQDQVNRLVYDVQLFRQGGRTVATLSSDSLFATVADSLSAGGTRRLKRVAAQLQQTYPNRTVRVEGHADSAPLSAALRNRYPSNWELSATRAATVVRALIELTSLDRSQFRIVALGSTDPIASNRTAAGRRQNRRVRVAVLPMPGPFSRPFETSW